MSDLNCLKHRQLRFIDQQSIFRIIEGHITSHNFIVIKDVLRKMTFHMNGSLTHAVACVYDNIILFGKVLQELDWLLMYHNGLLVFNLSFYHD